MTGRILILALGLCAMASAAAQNNDFLTDYSLLEETRADNVLTVSRYVPPENVARLKDYKAIFVDQPEIFIAADSKYKGAKGDQLKLLADTARLTIQARLEAHGYVVANEPGADVLYMRWAITDLYLKKKKRGILSYTPIGMVVHTTTQAAIRDLWKKINIVELATEVEFTDFVTGEVLVAAVSRRQGLRKDKGQEEDLVTWQELDAFFITIGERMVCGFRNATKPEVDLAECAKIWIEPEPE